MYYCLEGGATVEIGVIAFAAVATGGLSLVISQLAPKKEGASVVVITSVRLNCIPTTYGPTIVRVAE